MKKTVLSLLSLTALSFSISAYAADTSNFYATNDSDKKIGDLQVTSTDIEDGAAIEPEFANCVKTPEEKSGKGKDISPQLSWSNGPDGTKSYAIIMVDQDVPQDFSNANQEGKTIDAETPRQNFYHWIVANIPADINSVDRGEAKKLGKAGINSYADFYKDLVADTFKGYNGPCPPFNDERIHNYHFQVYALDVDKIDLKDGYRPDDIIKAIDGHVLAQGELVGTYSLYK